MRRNWWPGLIPRERTGLPAPKSIAGETEFTSPKGFKYRIIHTTEVDPSDQPKPSNPRPKGKQPRHKM